MRISLGQILIVARRCSAISTTGSGGYHNHGVVNNGNWEPVTVYMSTDGYVCLRFTGTQSYFGAIIDLHQFYGYTIRDIKVTEEAANDKENNLYGTDNAAENKGGRRLREEVSSSIKELKEQVEELSRLVMQGRENQ